MTPYQSVITTPNAWTNRALGGKAGLTHHLTRSQLAAFEEVLARTRHLKPQQVTRAEFGHKEIDALTAWLGETIRHGRGVALLSGITRDTHSEEDMERIYWGIGTHLGDAATQSALGDRLGHVRHVKDDPVARGYRGNQELTPHTDSHGIVGLMCLQRAETGGLSRIVSSLAIHNEIHATRPELLEPLYEGYYYAVSEAAFSSRPVTDGKIPVFCNIDGLVSCNYVRYFMERAAELRGETLPAKLIEALDYFNVLAKRDDIGVEFMLEPGEMLLWHNFQMLHARESYQDSPAHTRHLLRLWLKVENDRPVADAFQQRAEIYERVYRERSGRVPASELAGGEMIDISGKTAIVTGAASGIGLGIATALAEAGANVVMADIQKDAVEQAAHGLSGTNKRVMPLRIDVTMEQSIVDALAEAERAFGKLHIACNNAGVPMHGTRLIDVPVSDWNFVMGVNIWGIIHGIRHFVPAILKHGEEGHVVNTASVAGFQNRRGTNQGPYSMSKYAALSLSEALEHELEGTNVGVSVLCPGPIATNIARGARNRPEHMGGPVTRANDEAMLAERLAATGLDPKKVGERVVDAIRTKTFYAFVSAVPADVIRARHRRIEEALNTPWVTHY